MDHKGAFEQMDLLLAHLDIESRVRVLEDNILFCLKQGFPVECFRSAGFGEGVDVGPFAGGGSRWSGLPFLAEGVVEGFVREEGEEAFGAGWGGPGILFEEDVVLEVFF